VKRIAKPATRAEEKSTREAILDVAERRFAERGFSGVSVREIAAEVGLKNQASLYHYFRNKRALYEAVLARGVEVLVDLVAGGVSSATGTTDARSTVEQTLDRVIDYLSQHPHLPRLIQRAGVDDLRYFRTTVTRLLRPFFQQGIGILAVSGAPWRRDELPVVAAGMYHLIFGYFANAQLLSLVSETDWLAASEVHKQREFLKVAITQLLGMQRGGVVTPLRGATKSRDARGGTKR